MCLSDSRIVKIDLTDVSSLFFLLEPKKGSDKSKKLFFESGKKIPISV